MQVYDGSRAFVGKSELRQLTADVLFGDVRSRPHPHSMAALIGQGLTEKMIIDAGRIRGIPVPKMEQTLADLYVSLPYYQEMSDALTREYADDVLLCAARDDEVKFDTVCITKPGQEVHLLPASRYLWHSTGMMNAPAGSFFAQYGITRERVLGPDARKFVLSDSGFMGSIGIRMDEVIQRLYGVSLLEVGALDIRLTCARKDAVGVPILSGPAPEHAPLKKLRGFIDPDLDLPYGPIAMSMQNMPRYHATFDTLEQYNGRVVAMPHKDEKWVQDVDRCTGSNDSVVNPVAAAVTQFITVKAAMELSGNTDFAIQPPIELPPEPPRTRSLGSLWKNMVMRLSGDL